MPKFLDDIIAVGGSKLGIGTASPGDKLHVQDGYIRAAYSGGADFKLIPHSSNDGYGFYDVTNTNYDMWFDGGLVGIGTTSPAKQLHIDNPSGASAMLLEGAGGYSSEILFRTNPASGQGWLLYDYSGNTMTFGVNASEAMRIDSSQRVGIGHTTFYQKFTVNGNIDIRGGNDCLLTFNNGDGGIGVHYNNTGTVGRDIAIKTYEAGVGNTEKMRVTKDGKVGIGSTAPEAMLTVKSDAGNTNQPVRITNSATDTHTGLFLNNLGNTVGEKYGLQFGGYNEYSIGGIFGVMDSTSGSTSGDITIDFANGTSAGALVEKVRFTHDFIKSLIYLY